MAKEEFYKYLQSLMDDTITKLAVIIKVNRFTTYTCVIISVIFCVVLV